MDVKLSGSPEQQSFQQRAEQLKRDHRADAEKRFNREFSELYVHDELSISTRVLLENSMGMYKVPTLTIMSLIRAVYNSDNNRKLRDDMAKVGRKKAIRSYCERMAGVAGNSGLAEGMYQVMYRLLAKLPRIGALTGSLLATASVSAIICFLKAYKHGFHAGKCLEAIRHDMCSTAAAGALMGLCTPSIPVLIAGGLIAVALGWFIPKIMPQPELKPSWTELWAGMLEALGLRSPQPELEYVTDDRIDKLLRDAPDLLCPIYHILMTRPATLYGQVYEYDAIHKWVLENGRDPYDRPAVTSQIEPMPSMRALIQEFADENNVQLGNPDDLK